MIKNRRGFNYPFLFGRDKKERTIFSDSPNLFYEFHFVNLIYMMEKRNFTVFAFQILHQ